MALTKEEKEQLAEMYRGKDLYDPAKDPKQETASFEPQGLWGGGCAEGMAEGGVVGYDDGGTVATDGPIFSWDLPQGSQNDFDIKSSTDTVKDKVAVPNVIPSAADEPEVTETAPALPIRPVAPRKAAIPAPMVAPPPQNAPAAAPAKLSPDEYDELIKTLRPGRGASVGQGATSALAGLADAIMQGVARAGPGQFQKNIEESRQNQRQDLVNALKAKYETRFRGQELGQTQERLGQEAQRIAEETRSHKATEAETRKARELTERQQNLMAAHQGEQLKAEAAKNQVEAAQKVVEAYEKGGYNPFVAKPSAADYNRALSVIKSSGTPSGLGMNVVRIKDSTGQMHDIPAQNLARAKQRDPGLQVMQ